jgi:hypothetical protein
VEQVAQVQRQTQNTWALELDELDASDDGVLRLSAFTELVQPF